MNCLEKKFKITIDYDEDAEAATITDEKEIMFIFSGKTAKMIEDAARIEGLSKEDIRNASKMQMYAKHALEEAIKLRQKYYKIDEKDDCIYVKDTVGNIVHIIRPISNFQIEWEKNHELWIYAKEFLAEY